MTDIHVEHESHLKWGYVQVVQLEEIPLGGIIHNEVTPDESV